MGSYIAVRVRLPLPATLPDGSAQILRNLALAITRYYLFDQAPTDAVSTRYDQAMTWLKDFRQRAQRAARGCPMPPDLRNRSGSRLDHAVARVQRRHAERLLRDTVWISYPPCGPR